MLQTIINTTITIIVSSLLGFCVSKIKDYKKTLEEKTENEGLQNMALLNLLQNQLTNTYYVYNEIGEIPDYVLRNWLNLFKIYEQLGGNDYCHILRDKMLTWKVDKTDILK